MAVLIVSQAGSLFAAKLSLMQLLTAILKAIVFTVTVKCSMICRMKKSSAARRPFGV